MKNKIIICGLGRCGTSVTMQMLFAGGLDVCGTWPDFEDDLVLKTFDIDQILDEADGRAIKLIDPHRYNWPNYIIQGLKIIWLNRDPREQAKSQIHFIEFINKVNIPDRRQAISAFSNSIKKDKKQSFKLMKQSSESIHFINFECLIKRPFVTAQSIKNYLDLDLDISRMASVVRQRRSSFVGDLEKDINHRNICHE